MHIFLWFGWSIAWSVFCFFPLFRRLIGTLSGGAPVQQRQGSIRLLLGGVGAVCASSGLAALFGAERGAATADAIGSAAALQGNTFGHAFSAGLTGLFGYWGAILALAVLGAASLPWLFRLGRSARIEADDDTLATAPLYDGGRLDGVTAMPAASNTVGARISERKIQRDNDVAARRTGPWKLPGIPAAGSGYDARSPASAQSATATQMQTATRRAPWSGAANKPETAQPPRNESQWAPFESLRPTAAMMARSQKLAAGEPGRSARAGTGNTTVRAPATHTAATGMPVAPTRVGLLASRPASTVVKPAAAIAGAAAATITTATTTATQGSVQTSAFASKPAPATATPAVPYLAPKAPASSSWPWAADAPATSSSNAMAGARDVEVQQVANTPSAPSTPGFYTHGPASPGIRLPQHGNDTNGNNDDDNRPDMILPSLSLLDAGGDERFDIPAAQLEETGRLIEQRLKEFKVPVTVLGAYSGPVITRYEVEPALGVRGAQIVNLMKDLSRALGLTSIRVVETIPGKTCMGLELPNSKRQMIRLAEIFESDAYRQSDSKLTLAMGKDITGLPVVTDLARAPHMLVAGTTGSGKSVAINAMILSLLYKSTPQDVRLIMIDPKMLELSVYDGIPHLLAPVVTDMKLAGNALTWCVTEMDKRYRLMSALGVRNLAGYNQKIRDGIAAEKRVKNPFSLTPDAPEPLDTLPLIVVVIDELADLMMVTGKKIEELIARLAQKARAAGIHLILATQRPSVDVITGLIKANIPTRVAFQVSSKIDSRTVLDQMGAEALLGHGDMLFLPPGSGYPQRVHGAFVSDQEVHRVVQYLKSFGEPDYEEAILSGPPGEMADSDLAGDVPDPEADPLYDEAVAFVARTRRASISSVQRQFRVGYNRAARLVEQMEAAGILSSMATNGSRDVLVPPLAE